MHTTESDLLEQEGGCSMRSKLVRVILSVIFLVLLIGCGNVGNTDKKTEEVIGEHSTDEFSGGDTVVKRNNEELAAKYKATIIMLDDSQILVDGKSISLDNTSSVYASNDIVFYLEGQGFTYGEGTVEDEHSQEEADSHTVVHITQPGNYVLSGKLSSGQISVDLGEDAKEDKNAVVTLVLNNVDISCSVAPGVIFYNVYECGSDEVEEAAKDVDTTKAGANVIIADGSVNQVNGSYVARIYESVELNEDGTEVVDSKKLHKYDAAFYSKCSMNINGEADNNGVLNIQAENEGVGSELHLTINGGSINITSGNDGINTNEDEVSVTTINGGSLNIVVDGSTKEGDGIDSNGWLVINGGSVNAAACSFSGDSGIDSDMGIHINGGTVLATGNMLDTIADSTQNYVVLLFDGIQKARSFYELKTIDGMIIANWTPVNDFSMLVFSGESLAAGTYTLWKDGVQLPVQAIEDGKVNGPRKEMPEGERPKMPEGERPESPESERTQMPEDEYSQKSEGKHPNMLIEEMPQGEHGPNQVGMFARGEDKNEFEITDGGNMYMIRMAQ